MNRRSCRSCRSWFTELQTVSFYCEQLHQQLSVFLKRNANLFRTLTNFLASTHLRIVLRQPRQRSSAHSILRDLLCIYKACEVGLQTAKASRDVGQQVLLDYKER